MDRLRIACRVLTAALIIMTILAGIFPALPAEGAAARPPRFSHKSGFYNREFSLVLSPPAPGGDIYYTLDGSEPTEESRLYTGPIPIGFFPDYDGDIAYIETTMERVPASMRWRTPAVEPFKGTVVRARYFLKGADPSTVVTHTYFCDPDIQQRFSMPVIAIATDPAGFFSDETGIYVSGAIYEKVNSDQFSFGQHPANYNQRGEEWERPVHMIWYDPKGKVGFAQDMGVRIHGAWSRVQPLKSLRIYARTDYGAGTISFPFFEEGHIQTYGRLILRNGGQDFYRAYMRDAVAHSMVSHLDLDIQQATSVVVFINGVYWGIHYVRERYDERYFEKIHQIQADQIILLENYGVLMAGLPEDQQLWFGFLDFLKENQLADEENYQFVLSQIDLDSLLDHLILGIYSNNQDWPGNNVRFWRVREPVQTGSLTDKADGRWRWVVNDFDVAFLSEKHNMYDIILVESKSYPAPDWSTILLRRLMEQKEFRIRFLNRLDYHLNTTFVPDHGLKWIDHWEERLNPEMEFHIQRWQRPDTVAVWQENVEALRRFVQNRPKILREQTENAFGVSGSHLLTIVHPQPSQGRLVVNGIVLDAGLQTWQGAFFANTPLQLQVERNVGYAFSGWQREDGSMLSEDTLVLEEDLVLQPIFKRYIWAEPAVLFSLATLFVLGSYLWIRKLIRRKEDRSHSQMIWQQDDI